MLKSVCTAWKTGFEMNDEMAAFLQDCPEFEVQIVSSLSGDMTECSLDGNGYIFALKRDVIGWFSKSN